jgi:hypothetical protein
MWGCDRCEFGGAAAAMIVVEFVALVPVAVKVFGTMSP